MQSTAKRTTTTSDSHWPGNVNTTPSRTVAPVAVRPTSSTTNITSTTNTTNTIINNIQSAAGPKINPSTISRPEILNRKKLIYSWSEHSRNRLNAPFAAATCSDYGGKVSFAKNVNYPVIFIVLKQLINNVQFLSILKQE